MTTPLPDHVDVLIVGYGPVGATLACLLGEHGVHALVVDRADDVFTAPRAIALDHEALRILQRAGLPEGSFATLPIPSVCMRSPLVGEFARVDTRGTLDGHPRLATFHQPELERALRRQVATHRSVVTSTGTELVRFEDDGAGVWATLRRGARSHRVRARFLVGADGARSGVRAAIGQELEGETYPEEWLIVDALDVPWTIDHVEFLCDPRRPTPHMPAPGGRTRWEFMLQPGESGEAMLDEGSVQALIAPWTGGRAVTIERSAVYRFHARSCDRYRVGDVFLAGDAAHVTPPFAGQGLVAGLRDAVNLAWKLAWVVQGRCAPSILDSYDAERRPHARSTIQLARLLGRLIMPRSPLRAALLHGGVRFLGPVRRYFEDLDVKPDLTYDEGLFHPPAGGMRRGGWFPQLRLGLEDRDVWSDDLLGPGFALVGLGAQPALSPGAEALWSDLGGRCVTLDAGRALAPGAHGRPWCAVVRPDLTILHDGPAHAAERLVDDTFALLGYGAGRMIA